MIAAAQEPQYASSVGVMLLITQRTPVQTAGKTMQKIRVCEVWKKEKEINKVHTGHIFP